jgi:hypothetical protein
MFKFIFCLFVCLFCVVIVTGMLYNTEELPTKGTRNILYVLLITVVFTGTLFIAWCVISTLRYQKYLEKVSDADKVEKVSA